MQIKQNENYYRSMNGHIKYSKFNPVEDTDYPIYKTGTWLINGVGEKREKWIPLVDSLEDNIDDIENPFLYAAEICRDDDWVEEEEIEDEY